jgi:allantoinase
MAAYTRIVEEGGGPRDLDAYHRSRPPHSEGLAITIASYLAHETQLANINLLHLSSAKALDAALRMRTAFPHIDFRREVTIGHLLANLDNAPGIGAKVNPPIRPKEDMEALWEHLLAGDVDWVVSDHACCKDEIKFGEDRDDVFLAKSGFGGTEYLLPGLVGEGQARPGPARRSRASSRPTPRSATASTARATSLPATTRTSRSSTRRAASWCARTTRSRRRSTARSRASRSARR